jgi:signal recognition particle subunit SRP54
MTPLERGDPQALVREPSRVKRIAGGSGQPQQAVSELVQKFLFMRQMMGGLGQNAGLFGNIPGFRQMNMARNLRRAMKSGKFPDGVGGMGMPGMGMPGMGMPGMGMPGMGMPGMPPGMGPPAPRMKVLSKVERNAKKNQRKRERDARKKGKKR